MSEYYETFGESKVTVRTDGCVEKLALENIEVNIDDDDDDEQSSSGHQSNDVRADDDDDSSSPPKSVVQKAREQWVDTSDGDTTKFSYSYNISTSSDDDDEDDDDDDDEYLGASSYVCTECETVLEDIDDTALKTEAYCTECDAFRRVIRGDHVERSSTGDQSNGVRVGDHVEQSSTASHSSLRERGDKYEEGGEDA